MHSFKKTFSEQGYSIMAIKNMRITVEAVVRKMIFKIGVLKNFVRPATLLKRDSNNGVFL